MVTLQEGKFYKARNGCMIGPMEEEIDGDYMAVHPIIGDTASWHPDGTRFKYDPDYVLVEEWQEVAMETGTLKELNVKPGDVVEPASNTDGGERFEVMEDCKLKAIYAGGGVHVLNRGWYWNECIFRIISRASTLDLTAITTPFGLLDAATQQALRAHGGPYEFWNSDEWNQARTPRFDGSNTYRVKPGPISETIRVTIAKDDEDGLVIAEATVTTRNGKPDWSTMQVHNG